MSDPQIAIRGRTRTAPCDRCSLVITEQAFAGMFKDGVRYSANQHLAPCGLECFGAAVSGRSYRLDEVHGKNDECPRCGRAPLRPRPLTGRQCTRRRWARQGRR